MASGRRVCNLSRPGYYLKMRSAEKAVESCASAWVEYGVTIRDLTIAEAIAARNDQARNREPLARAELPGLKFEPPANAAMRARAGFRLAWEANRLAQA